MDCPTKKGGHKASTYRQIEQYPDPTRRSYCSGPPDDLSYYLLWIL